MKDFLLSAADRTPNFQRGANAIDLTGEDADTFFDALASETSRDMFEMLYEEPATPSELAAEFDTSLQNIHYHLKKLQAADLIESVDTVYSSRGQEVQVYAPTHEALVLITGDESTVSQVKALLSRFVGILALLAVSSLLVQGLLVGGPLIGDPIANPLHSDAPGGATNATATPGQVEFHGADDSSNRSLNESRHVSINSSKVSVNTTGSNQTATPSPTPTPAPAGPVHAVPPGLVFFAGGLMAVLLALGWQASALE